MVMPGTLDVCEGIHMGICIVGWLVATQHSPQSWEPVELEREQKFTSPSSRHICSRQNSVNLDTQPSSSPGVLTLAHKKITQEMDLWLCRCLGSDTRYCESPSLKWLPAGSLGLGRSHVTPENADVERK